MKNDTILIAGGGIGGFATALALSQQGLSVHLLEQATEFAEVGAGIQLGPNVFKMFDVLGLTEAVNDVAVFPEALVMNDALDGHEVTRIPINNAAFRARFNYPYGVIYRPDLHNILIEACQRSPLIQLTLQQKVVVYKDTSTGVQVTTETGQTFTGTALVAADGLWSSIRAQMLNDGDPLVSGHIAYRAVLPTEEVPEHLRLNQVILWAGPKTHLVQYPLHRGEIFNLVAVFHSDRYEEGWDVFGDSDELNAKFASQHDHVLAMLDKIESWRMWVLCDREPVRQWSEGRVVLLGDAAHPMLQYLAQGACMAIEDAVCLASKISSADGDYAGAFKAYQQARYLRTARVQITARFYGQAYHAADATADLRNTLLARRDPAGAFESMAWLYEGIDANGNQCL